MFENTVRDAFLLAITTPFIYYLLVLYSSRRFFLQAPTRNTFTPPVSILKPIRGVDPESYLNFASFCNQNYPEYEILFCVGQSDDPVIPILEEIIHDFPECRIRIVFGPNQEAANDKVAKLRHLVAKAQYEIVVMGDSDVRVTTDYLRTVVSPLADPEVGAVTCFYLPAHSQTLAENLQTIGMVSDFYAGLLVGWQLEGIKFALGATIATSRKRLAEFGGLQAIENQPGDDLLIGRLIAEHGHEVKLLPYMVMKLGGCHSFKELLAKRMRWMVVMKHMRRSAHFGLLFTQGLPWVLAAIAVHPSAGLALAYLGIYLGLRIAIAWSIGIRGLNQTGLWKVIALIPLWDALAFCIWLASFLRKSIQWRDNEYYIRDGMLVAASSRAAEK
ncbi:MAG: glycosyltransferase [Candidatus Acidiferrales bacterium]